MYPKISFRPIKKKPSFESRFETAVEKKLAVVEFSRTFNQDGIFALQMTRKIFLKNVEEEAKLRKEGKSLTDLKPAVMIFEHYKNAEDFDDSHKNYNSKGYIKSSYNKK